MNKLRIKYEDWNKPIDEKYLEVNPEPIEPKKFYNPSIEDMLNNPQCMIQYSKDPVYLDDDEDFPDNFDNDIQDIINTPLSTEKPVKPSEAVPATDEKDDDAKEEQSDDDKEEN